VWREAEAQAGGATVASSRLTKLKVERVAWTDAGKETW